MGAASCSDGASSAAPPDQPAADSAAGAASSSGAGSSRNSASLAASKFGAQNDELLQQSVAQLAAGHLRIHARVVSTQNAIEETLASTKIVTKFVVEVQQMGFKWEVARRYSEFAAFNEELADSWAMPELPPKLFQNEETDIAERMLRLDAYLKELLAQPALMLSLPARATPHATAHGASRVLTRRMLSTGVPVPRRSGRPELPRPAARRAPARAPIRCRGASAEGLTRLQRACPTKELAVVRTRVRTCARTCNFLPLPVCRVCDEVAPHALGCPPLLFVRRLLTTMDGRTTPTRKTCDRCGAAAMRQIPSKAAANEIAWARHTPRICMLMARDDGTTRVACSPLCELQVRVDLHVVRAARGGCSAPGCYSPIQSSSRSGLRRT
jgi:hypothetical protein